MRWTMVRKKLRWNLVNEVDNVTREELSLSGDVMVCCKAITEHHLKENLHHNYV